MSLATSASITCFCHLSYCKITYLSTTEGFAAYQTQAYSIFEEEMSGYSISQPLQ